MKLPRLEQLLFFLILLFLPTQLGKHFWFDFSYIYSLPVDYLLPTIYFWDLLVFALVFTWAFKKPRINRSALTLSLLFILSQALSLFTSSNIGAGLTRLYLYLPPLLLFIYLASNDLGVILSRSLIPLCLAVIFEALLGIGQVLFSSSLGFWILGERSFSANTPFIATFNFFGKVLLRPYATFPHPNVLATFVALFWVFLKLYKGVELSGYFSQLKKIASWTSLLVLVLTFSRTEILGLLIAELCLNFQIIKSLRVANIKKWVLENPIDPKGAAILAISLCLFIPTLIVRFLSLINYDQVSWIRRFELGAVAINAFLSSPFLGVGLNNFIPYLASSELVSGEERFLQPVHNIALLALSETGIVGIVGLVSLFVFTLQQLTLSPSTLRKYLVAIFLLIAGLSLFDHFFITLPQGLRILFFMFGLIFSKQQNIKAVKI